MSTINAFTPAVHVASVDTTPAVIQAARRFRNMFKEAHPFARDTAFLRPHPVAWEFYTTRFARAAKFYPLVVLFLGWPFAMKYAVNYSNGVYDAPKNSRRN
ncbi:uncharacterized protein MYCFIDRAFT_210593 [Pseudocercospora fijiensis CIRAD86]|uniref:Uncharacterized protein n=1 Tax=Pseudocercospora fijiensis (strain CIRAD86) TaxID=383855 RepID=M3BBT0_PSEFD|nr:uncharacterized protein MYCFIDRAFT_210593 [Pseudocercospora fijiensis CIRAD86]EME86732.1 hypothetical protein MYCFIDRAFT_210593 [Pseudocercospora fijiensis CIRAD86]